MAIGITSSATQSGLVSNFNKFSDAKSTNLRKLSSGFRIGKASDNAAGLAIAIRLNTESSALSQASQNVSSGLSMLNTADGGLNQISDMLIRAKELAVQSANGSLDDSTRQAINTEFDSITSEISRIASSTEFSGQDLLAGDFSSGSSDQFDIQAGASNTSSDRINLNVIEGATSSQLGLDNIDVSTIGNAQNAIDAIDSALDQVSTTMANIGATQNRLSFANANLSTSIVNLQSATSVIRDTDIAFESISLAQNQIGQDAALSAIKNANEGKKQLIGKLLNTKG